MVKISLAFQDQQMFIVCQTKIITSISKNKLLQILKEEKEDKGQFLYSSNLGRLFMISIILKLLQNLRIELMF